LSYKTILTALKMTISDEWLLALKMFSYRRWILWAMHTG